MLVNEPLHRSCSSTQPHMSISAHRVRARRALELLEPVEQGVRNVVWLGRLEGQRVRPPMHGLGSPTLRGDS